MTLLLHDIFPIAAPNDYKLHFARWNRDNQPLEVWVRDREEWQGWQEYRPARNDFNRSYIFTLIQFYHEADTWLFGGIFRVVRRHPDRYEVELTDQGRASLAASNCAPPIVSERPGSISRSTIGTWRFRRFSASPTLGESFLGSRTSISRLRN